MIVSFDFDGTLHHKGVPCPLAVERWRFHIKRHDTIYIVTHRTGFHEHPNWYEHYEPHRYTIRKFLDDHLFFPKEVIFTAHGPKSIQLWAIMADMHYDNSLVEVNLCLKEGILGLHAPGCFSQGVPYVQA